MRQRSRARGWVVLIGLALVAAACSETATLEVARHDRGSAPVGGEIIGEDGGVSDADPQDPGAQATVPDGPGPQRDGGSATTGAVEEVAAAPSEGEPGGVRDAVEGPIRLGVLSTLSGGERFVGEPPYRVALAYAERLNAAGGINGRMVEVLGYDVCTNCPDEGLAQAKKAVEVDDVYALVNTFVVNASLDQVVPYLNDRGVPMVQGSSGSQTRRPELSPYNFSIGLTVPGRAAIGADFVKSYLQEKGLPLRVALLYFTDALTSYIAEEQRAALKRVGLDVVVEMPVSYDATMTNQSSQVIRMRASGAQMVVGSHGVLCAFNLQAAEQQGWDAPYLCTVMYDPFATTIAGPAALTGRDVFADTEGYGTEDMATPGMQDFLDLMSTHYPDGDVGLVTLYSYLGMRVVEEGIREMGENVTRAGLAQHLEGLRRYDAGGLTAPFSLSPQNHGGINGTHLVKLNPDGSFQRVTADWTYPAPIHNLPGPVR